MTEKVPQVVVDRVRRVEHLLPASVFRAILEMSREEVLDAVRASMAATEEALLASKARYLTGSLFLGDIQSERSRQAEAHFVSDAFEEAQLYRFKLEKLQELYSQLVPSPTSPSNRGLRRGALLKMLPDVDGGA